MIEKNIDAHILKVSKNFFGQRIDNFLKNYLKSVPKSMIYRLIRTGKIRVNIKKVNFFYKLQINDVLQLPSIQRIKVYQIPIYSKKKVEILQKSVMYEDDHILVLNKPSGIAVHNGSGIKFNIIDGLRNILNSKTAYLKLVHRLDRDTSGILMLAKSRIALIFLQKQWRLQKIQKEYLALVYGLWNKNVTSISLSLIANRMYNKNSQHMKYSTTNFQILESFDNAATLLKVRPITGHTHQIRSHTQYVNHPIIGDRIYGDYQINIQFEKFGYNRLFLHASKLCFIHPNKKKICINAPIDELFYNCILFLRKSKRVIKNLVSIGNLKNF